ncbi:suppressor of fused domain protein [Rubinisphaera margarita]|uniref:suppressor of fused domain protein n=1 Tax=Rubinisphaera margarita TaxID=2909586 RepID=UPI001EE8CCB2|nr:suppressor of fused domain protein [Rubinisphaera margarita]MCG6156532.1 suppressor of fused domain protein [Rubinisphaera margarita]
MNEQVESPNDEDEGDQWYDEKSRMMAESLGEEHDSVLHAMIPYAVGGALDVYLYPNGLPGTGFATKELSEDLGECSRNDEFDAYEMVMFTRHALPHDPLKDEESPFGQTLQSCNQFLNLMARYSAQAELNPGETCEFPEDMEDVGGRSLIFDAYSAYESDDGDTFGLLMLMEIFRSELEFTREHGGEELLDRLKAAGHFPYSDMDREPVA